MIRTLIVDDEEQSRVALRHLLRRCCPQLEVVAEAGGKLQAQEEIVRRQPELVFLDVEMPDGSGFDLLKDLPRANFALIFVTAHEHYALRAIKCSALDYLLKPVLAEDLRTAIARVDVRYDGSSRAALLREQLLEEQPDRIALPTHDGFEIVRIAEIVRAQACSNYTIIVMSGGIEITVPKTLGEYEKLLGDQNFVRVHRSHLLNVRHVRRYRRGRGGCVTMSDGMEIEISQHKKECFLQYFSR